MWNPFKKKVRREPVEALVASLHGCGGVTINKGTFDGIKSGDRILVYPRDGTPILDPITGEVLEVLNEPKYFGHVQVAKDRCSICYDSTHIRGNSQVKIGDVARCVPK